MKFFTRELYESLQGDPSRPEVSLAEKQWDSMSQDYQKHLESILSYLPDGVRLFCDHNLHDGRIVSTIYQDDDIILNIDCSNCWNSVRNVSLRIVNVEYSEGAESLYRDFWLYEELHLGTSSNFCLHVLLEKSEFIVSAEDLQMRLTS